MSETGATDAVILAAMDMVEGSAWKIVPADAVVISPEIARTAADACDFAAMDWEDRDCYDKMREAKAVAAALRGEG